MKSSETMRSYSMPVPESIVTSMVDIYKSKILVEHALELVEQTFGSWTFERLAIAAMWLAHWDSLFVTNGGSTLYSIKTIVSTSPKVVAADSAFQQAAGELYERWSANV